MKIRIIKPGLFTTVQDLGRMEHLREAVPVSGAMDSLAARVANIALGNSPDQAVLELTFSGTVFEAETDALIAWAGDGASLLSAKGAIPAERAVLLRAGERVKVVNDPVASRICLAVAGGWNVSPVLGSRSTYAPAGLGGIKGSTLVENAVLTSHAVLPAAAGKILQLLGDDQRFLSWGPSRASLLPSRRNVVRVVRGKETSWFTPETVQGFFNSPYLISNNSNRIGFLLEGPLIARRAEDELLSAAVLPGTIQVTHSGDALLLMADCQTTGGYPRIAQVIAADLPLCAQLLPGTNVRFAEVTFREAEELFLQQEADLVRMQSAVAMRLSV